MNTTPSAAEFCAKPYVEGSLPPAAFHQILTCSVLLPSV